MNAALYTAVDLSISIVQLFEFSRYSRYYRSCIENVLAYMHLHLQYCMFMDQKYLPYKLLQVTLCDRYQWRNYERRSEAIA